MNPNDGSGSNPEVPVEPPETPAEKKKPVPMTSLWASTAMKSQRNPLVAVWLTHTGSLFVIGMFAFFLLRTAFDQTGIFRPMMEKSYHHNYNPLPSIIGESPCTDCPSPGFKEVVKGLTNFDLKPLGDKVKNIVKPSKKAVPKDVLLTNTFKSAPSPAASALNPPAVSETKKGDGGTAAHSTAKTASSEEYSFVKIKLRKPEVVLDEIRKDPSRTYIDQEIRFGEVSFHFRNVGAKGMEIYVVSDSDARKTYYYPKVIYDDGKDYVTANFESDILTQGKGIYGYIAVPNIKEKNKVELKFSVVGGESGKDTVKIKW